MSSQNTIVRSMHDVGLASWFGGSLMGAAGLNGAANDIGDESDRSRIAASGWARWAPVAAASIGAHVIGSVGLVVANRDRIANQSGVATISVVKTVLTGAAVAATAYSGVLGARIAKAGKVPADGGTVPNEQTPDEVASSQQQLRVVQWVIPALTGILLVLTAKAGEQQKPASIAAGIAKKAARTIRQRANA